jgi:hypothetical protein
MGSIQDFIQIHQSVQKLLRGVFAPTSEVQSSIFEWLKMRDWKCSVELNFSGSTCLPNFMKIHLSVQKLLEGHTHRQGDMISLLSFLENALIIRRQHSHLFVASCTQTTDVTIRFTSFGKRHVDITHKMKTLETKVHWLVSQNFHCLLLVRFFSRNPRVRRIEHKEHQNKIEKYTL